jgi:tricorn protease
VCALLAAPSLWAQSKPLRFPDVHGDKVVFTFAGDLWLASTSGGAARRLTAHPGMEVFARFSPDGKWIAFTGQYDGDEQVYVMPAEGGEPKQLTFYPARGPLAPRHGYDHQVYGWTRDGKSVLFRSMSDSGGDVHGRLYTVATTGGAATPLPLPEAGAGAFSPDGKRLVYSPQYRDFRTEKRYKGGWANVLYIYDLASAQADRISGDDPHASRDPMWIGEKIYFATDRDGTMNLYSYDIKSKQTKQLTHSKPWDVRWPSADSSGSGMIAYELDGEIHLFDTRNDQDRKITIQVQDDGLYRRPSRVSAANMIEQYNLSPKGERALFAARGDIFTAPIEKGPTRNLTNSSNSHEKWPTWSPDGRKIAFISDRSGEEEVYLMNQDGTGAAERITSDGHAMRYEPRWASTGKHIALSDKDGVLWVVTLADKKIVQVAKDRQGGLRDYKWSPDGNFLAFSTAREGGFRAVYIWSLADGQTHLVSDSFFNSYGPAWDPEGNYLWYLADREFAPELGSFELDYIVSRETGIFGMALRKDVKNVFGTESDEVTLAPEEGAKPAADASKPAAPAGAPAAGAPPAQAPAKKEKEPLKIDFDGLAARVTRVPITSDNIGGLSATKGFLVYGKGGDGSLGRESGRPTMLMTFSLKDRKDTQVTENVLGYALSEDGTKLLLRQGPEFKLFDVPSKGPQSAKSVSTAGLMVDRVPAEEWVEIFEEVWRRYRDYFYVKNMHGYDWKALHDQYRPLAESVKHRSDLNFVIGEMIAELNVGHAYIEGGDFQAPPRPRVALPGARFEVDASSNRYRISHIYRGQNEEERYRSPLTEIGVDAKEGDYVLAVDGQDVNGSQDIYQFLRNKADRNVQLTLNSKPAMDGSRTISFRPVASEANLVYLDWVNQNREMVDKLSGGKVAYLHIPDMGADGIREFIKYFYPQIRKEGLIVDVRSNGGGFVSQMVIERLRRELLGTDFARNNQDTSTYPNTVFYGPMVCLINESSASDGDIFPYMFRQAHLGPLIGKRTWGGVVGISGHGPLIDGGTIFVPEFASADLKGNYVIEGHGVDPDIVVEKEPKAALSGHDPQLERGVAEVMKMMQQNPKKLPTRAADPVKTKP